MNGKQLKNSILQWAIQGKLVPQDPNDEPASILLERIRAEKAKLVKEKKIKKDKNESIIYRGDDNSYYEKFLATGEVKCIDEEIPFDIPQGWEWCRLKHMCSMQAGKNIFLYGAVLGYGRQYMEEKYDQIVEFSGLEDFMDVPIKNYSSGMKSKLGFAIATIAEPEILILDEVLSVGDGKFRKKSEKKILDMMQDGTAVLFVSHSLAQVKRICNKAMILEGGKMIAFGDVDEVAQVYAEMTGELDELTVGQKNLVKKKNKKKKTEKIKQEDKREVMEES